jgi:hypothetical protein
VTSECVKNNNNVSHFVSVDVILGSAIPEEIFVMSNTKIESYAIELSKNILNSNDNNSKNAYSNGVRHTCVFAICVLSLNYLFYSQTLNCDRRQQQRRSMSSKKSEREKNTLNVFFRVW